MNASEIETFKEMKTVVKANTKILIRIDKTLHGDKEKDKYDMGLVGDVRNNVRWKKNIQKVLSVLGLGIAGMWVKDGWTYLKGL